MKLNSVNLNKLDFKGLIPEKVSRNARMYAFDLDGTLLEGQSQSRERILESARDKVLTYASGKTLDDLVEVAGEGKTLPLPDYFIGKNGHVVYKKNPNEQMEEVTEWTEDLRQGFNREKIQTVVHEIAEEYPFSVQELQRKPDVDSYLQRNPNWGRFKVSEYPASKSEQLLKFVTAPDVSEQVSSEIAEAMESSGINVNVTTKSFPKSNLARIEEWFPKATANEIRDIIDPLMISDTGYYNTLSISSKKTKADGVDFVREKEGINPEQVIAAGNALNDASLTKFPFVLMPDAEIPFKTLVDNRQDQSNIYRPDQIGADGIWQAIKPDNM